MGRVRTKTVKKSAKVIIERYYPKLTLDFETNKRICDEIAVIASKRLRNKIAGYTTHLMKRIQRGPVRGISFKLQEEERERKDQYVPEVSALDFTQNSESGMLDVDQETKDMLKSMGVRITWQIAGGRVLTREPVRQHRGQRCGCSAAAGRREAETLRKRQAAADLDRLFDCPAVRASLTRYGGTIKILRVRSRRRRHGVQLDRTEMPRFFTHKVSLTLKPLRLMTTLDCQYPLTPLRFLAEMSVPWYQIEGTKCSALTNRVISCAKSASVPRYAATVLQQITDSYYMAFTSHNPCALTA
ncbi:40S ribosomal protein S17.e.B [Teratosphaeriaceae sp. CCFEE 6253]|nr:40S ribosomal protein S17.e.B [Teratosphaeriaceae sp. CCFEE 6253]